MTNEHADARERIIAAIDAYLVVIQRQPADRPRPLRELARALDELVMCYHATPDVEPDTVDGPEAPRVDEGPLLDNAAAAFPDLDWYAVVDPQEGQDQQVGMSMAIGGIVEIAADLIEVLWLFENAGENDAIWQFRFGYQSHWGRHLHEIRPYLHAMAAW